MNISHYPCDGNRAKLIAIQGMNQSQYLQPDYFLSSSNNSYLGKKYHKLPQRISRIVSATFLSGLVLTTAVNASASSNSVVPVLLYMQDHGTKGHHTTEPMMPPPPSLPPPAFGLEKKSTLLMQLANQKGDQHYCRRSRILARRY